MGPKFWLRVLFAISLVSCKTVGRSYLRDTGAAPAMGTGTPVDKFFDADAEKEMASSLETSKDPKTLAISLSYFSAFPLKNATYFGSFLNGIKNVLALNDPSLTDSLVTALAMQCAKTCLFADEYKQSYLTYLSGKTSPEKLQWLQSRFEGGDVSFTTHPLWISQVKTTPPNLYENLFAAGAGLAAFSEFGKLDFKILMEQVGRSLRTSSIDHPEIDDPLDFLQWVNQQQAGFYVLSEMERRDIKEGKNPKLIPADWGNGVASLRSVYDRNRTLKKSMEWDQRYGRVLQDACKRSGCLVPGAQMSSFLMGQYVDQISGFDASSLDFHGINNQFEDYYSRWASFLHSVNCADSASQIGTPECKPRTDFSPTAAVVSIAADDSKFSDDGHSLGTGAGSKLTSAAKKELGNLHPELRFLVSQRSFGSATHLKNLDPLLVNSPALGVVVDALYSPMLEALKSDSNQVTDDVQIVRVLESFEGLRLLITQLDMGKTFDAKLKEKIGAVLVSHGISLPLQFTHNGNLANPVAMLVCKTLPEDPSDPAAFSFQEFDGIARISYNLALFEQELRHMQDPDFHESISAWVSDHSAFQSKMNSLMLTKPVSCDLEGGIPDLLAVMSPVSNRLKGYLSANGSDYGYEMFYGMGTATAYTSRVFMYKRP